MLENLSFDNISIRNLTEEEIIYSVAFTRTMTGLEAELHSCEDPAEIAMGALQAGAEFYGGDWCGIIEGDLVMEAWRPVLWYNTEKKGMSETAFKDLEDTYYVQRWVQALKECRPVIIEDTEVFKDSDPVEYELYRRCHAKSIMAVPFWKNPMGFMIVRNPTRFHLDSYQSGFLQAVAYVAFSAVTEQKLIHRNKMAVSPEMIKKDTDVNINLFGGLEICTSKGILREEDLNSPRMCRMLVYLLQRQERAVPAKKIAEDIWQDEDVDAAGNKIKNLVYRLQSVFSVISDYRLIVSTPLGYQLNPELNIMTDVQRFEDLWVSAQGALALQAKIELLKNAIELYRGNVYPPASGEHWMLHFELSCKHKCEGIFSELMKALYESKKYSEVQCYASKALKMDRGFLESYYWLIRTMNKKDSPSMVKGELKSAQIALTSEEFDTLRQRLEKVMDIPM